MEILFLIGGLVFLFVGRTMIWNQIEALLFFERAKGKTTAVERRTTPSTASHKKGGPIYYPVVEYIAKGNKKRFTDSMGTNWPTNNIDETVTVLYSIKKDEARILSVTPLFIGVIFAIAGTGFCVIFYDIFTFSIFPIIIYSLFVLLIYKGILKSLKSRNINSLDELREAFRKTKMSLL